MSVNPFDATQSFGDSTELDVNQMSLGELDEPFVIPISRRKGGKGKPKKFPFYRLDESIVKSRQPYSQLADIVLGANQDVKFHRSLTDRAIAGKYAKDHRLKLGDDKDYNEDGINDVILFNKWGDPVVINGHALANTDYPYRKAFYEANPKKSDRMRAGGYNKWLKQSLCDHSDIFYECSHAEISMCDTSSFEVLEKVIQFVLISMIISSKRFHQYLKVNLVLK